MISYEVNNDIAVLSMDDGKANVVGHTLIDDIYTYLDRAEQEAKAVVIAGREGIFSGGFDLSEFAKGAEASLALVQRGFPMLLRMFKHPQPLIAACTGHGIAAGSFMLLACDTRVAASGNYKHRLPETAIGMTLPGILHELAAARLSPRYLTAAVIQAQAFTPEQAVEAGFVDELSEPDAVVSRAFEVATLMAEMPTKVYAQNKLDCRRKSIDIMQASIDEVLASSSK